jgi:two-component system heavy metal sensor histidine kinase CusS
MSIRTRLTLWFVGMLLGSFLLMAGILHHELVGEYEEGRPRESPGEIISDIVLFYGLPTALLLLIGGSYVVRRALRPVEQLTAAAERVHAGNLTERIPGSGRADELDRLAAVFNAMLARVEQGVESVRNFGLNTSHELRTPITILCVETELALQEPGRPEPERARLVSQLEELRRLGALVDALGLLAKRDAGIEIMVREQVEVEKIFRAAVADVQVLAARRAIAVTLTHCDPATLLGDPSRLRQAMLNLLENAVKHNRSGGWVTAELRRAPDRITWQLENSSDGIPADFLPRVFDRFARGAGVTEGSGLGLSIARTIVEAHHGTIACVNHAPGVVRVSCVIPTDPARVTEITTG